MVGIVEEQHPERARLFMQWKRMGWPILVDPLNLLNVPTVPITLGIDERGVIRVADFEYNSTAGLEERFLDRTFAPPAESNPGGSAPSAAGRPDLAALRAATARGSAADWRAYAEALTLWGRPEKLGEAIDAFGQALRLDPDDGPTRFRLGVALRMRHDSDRRQPGDFQAAVDAWSRALDIDPNNYIWRRRIQQYGPRLDKPYSFYDWVNEARREIEARGEKPAPLGVEPTGAEYAYPAEALEERPPGGGAASQPPDPQGRVMRDRQGLIRVETAIVPPAVRAGEAARAHVTFAPDSGLQAHWNNEVEDLVFWVDPPEGWEVGSRRLTIPRPPQTVSEEPRSLELEIRAPASAPPGEAALPGYALYYVCEGARGTCLYRRQDVSLRLLVRN